MAPAIYPTERYVDQYVSPLGKKTVDFDEIVASRACGGETKLSWWNREYGSRLGWLASEVIGADSELVTPFGSRRITYCDHTASGRCLWFIEEYLATQVLPFYGWSHLLLLSVLESFSPFLPFFFFFFFFFLTDSSRFYCCPSKFLYLGNLGFCK